MLKQDENELITRVGPGTPMGNFMREYWVPAMLSSEVPTPDSDPVRILLLGEQLIGFRDSNGKVGLIQNHCPHRGASWTQSASASRSGWSRPTSSGRVSRQP